MNDHDLIPIDGELVDDQALAVAGQVANQYAQAAVFAEYLARRAENTRRRQLAGLRLFADYLWAAGIDGITGEGLQANPAAWQGITWGLVDGFRRWQLQQGYAVGSINVRLSTVKTYAGLAFQAGVIAQEEHALIRQVAGYTRKEARHLDEQRDQIRRGIKKAEAVRITPDHAERLKQQPDTPQGRRDALLMCLLLDHGLRCSEVAGLTVDAINLQTRELVFYRQKVDKTQVHALSDDTYWAARRWFESGDVPAIGELLRGSRSQWGHGERRSVLTGSGMSTRAITKRVRQLGEAIGVEGLSAHDCRHYWATHAARSGTDPFALQEAGGWSSLAMPRRYVENAKIANEGVKGF